MKTPAKTGRKPKVAVMHRTKHDKTLRRCLSDHPAMIKLYRMVAAGAVNTKRTIEYLEKETRP